MQFNVFRKYCNKILNTFNSLTRPYKIGFVQGHSYLSDNQISKIRDILNTDNCDGIVSKYEQQFSALIGDGYAISFAAGRMAFYSLMKALGIGSGDEVILPGFTCSVMPNAVFRVGAKPVFADIDEDSFGSGVEDIKKKITVKTKLIVVQHSFGIPCDIQPIVDLGKKSGIFVVEDCAITLDSSVNGLKVGNWGDAAIFSTDHSKPINTLIGGLLYTKDESIHKKMKNLSVRIPQLDNDRQKRLFKRFLFEQKYYIPENYQKGVFLTHLYSVKKKLKLDSKSTFLDADYSKHSSGDRKYPYPAKMPPFLAQLGLFELERWSNEKQRRKDLLKKYLEIMQESGFGKTLPKVYLNPDVDIVPLRFVFTYQNAKELLNKMTAFIDINWIWFRTPVICCPDGPESVGYEFGSCPVSEKIGANIINLPCVVPENWDSTIINVFKKVIYGKN